MGVQSDDGARCCCSMSSGLAAGGGGRPGGGGDHARCCNVASHHGDHNSGDCTDNPRLMYGCSNGILNVLQHCVSDCVSDDDSSSCVDCVKDQMGSAHERCCS